MFGNLSEDQKRLIEQGLYAVEHVVNRNGELMHRIIFDFTLDVSGEKSSREEEENHGKTSGA